jgi:DNA-binding transcriptional LysR family regulator
VGGLITALSKAFLKKNPKAELVLLTGMPKKICEMILNNELSFGVIVGVTSHPELDSIPIARDEIVIVVGASHPLSAQESISPGELSGQSFIYTKDPPPYTRSILAELNRNGVSINDRFMEIDSMESIRQTLKTGVGVSALLRQFVAEDLRDGSLHQISLEGGPLYVDISLIKRKNRFLSPLSRKFIDYVIQEKSAVVERYGQM